MYSFVFIIDDAEKAAFVTATVQPAPEYKATPKLLALPLPELPLPTVVKKKAKKLEYQPEKPALNASCSKKRNSLDSVPVYIPAPTAQYTAVADEDSQQSVNLNLDDCNDELDELTGIIDNDALAEDAKFSNDDEDAIDIKKEEEIKKEKDIIESYKTKEDLKRPIKIEPTDREKRKRRDSSGSTQTKSKHHKSSSSSAASSSSRNKESLETDKSDKTKKEEEKPRDKEKSKHRDRDKIKEEKKDHRSSSSTSKHKSSSSSTSSSQKTSSSSSRDKDKESKHKSSSSSSTTSNDKKHSSSSSSKSKSSSSSSKVSSSSSSSSKPSTSSSSAAKKSSKESSSSTSSATIIKTEKSDVDSVDTSDLFATTEEDIMKECEMIYDQLEQEFATMHQGNADNEKAKEAADQAKAALKRKALEEEDLLNAANKKRKAYENADKHKCHNAPAVVHKPDHRRNAMQVRIFTL